AGVLQGIPSRHGTSMTRYFCIALAAILESVLSAHAQDKKDPPKTFTNGIGMKFVWIPAGTFVMGSPKDGEGRELFRTNEAQHKVTLSKGCFMGVHTVTQEQWKKVIGDNTSRFKGAENLPVENVSWVDCQNFIKK